MYQMECIFLNIGFLMCVNAAYACHCNNKQTYMWQLRQGFKRLEHLQGWRSVSTGWMTKKDKGEIAMEVDRQRDRSQMEEVFGNEGCRSSTTL